MIVADSRYTKSSQKVKIKICSPQLGMSPFSSLGGEIYDYQTLKGFTKKGFEVFVYLPRGKKYDTKLKNLHVTYSFFSHIFPPISYSFICLPYLLMTYKKEKFDVLRIHTARFLGVAGILFHLIHPEVLIISSAVTVDSPKIYSLIEKHLYKISKKIIVQSNYMKKILVKKYGVNPQKVAVTYGGQLDLEIPSKSTKSPGQSVKDNKIVLYMGVLIKRKNPLFLIEVFNRIKSKYQKVKLVIIGDGELRPALIRLIREKSLEKDVILLRSAYNLEKSFWLSKMNIFVLPSTDEGFGLAVTEAMSLAKPVIVSDIEPFKEIIENKKDGFTIPLKEKEWEKTILELLTDEELANKIGSSAKIKVENKFDWEKTYELNKKTVLDVINENRSTSS